MPSPSARPPANAPKPARPSGLRERLFSALGTLSTRRPGVVVALFLVLSALAYLYVRDFPIRTAYLDLLPQEDPLILKFQSVEQEMASTDVIAVLFTLVALPQSMEERERILVTAAERVIANLDLDNTPDLVSVSYRAGEGVVVPPELLIFQTLSPKELDRLREIAREFETRLLVPPAVQPLDDTLRATPRLEQADPAVVRAMLGELAEAGRAALSLLEEILAGQELLAEAAAISRTVLARPAPEVTGDPILSRDRDHLVLQIWPSRRAFESLPFNQAVTHVVRDAVAQAALDDLGVTAGITGTYVTTVEADVMIRQDMGLVTVVSSVVVFVLVLLAFASPLLCLAAVMPVLVSALFTMAWAKFAVGGFNLLTVFLPALILGLGIDFSIHILSRYVEERAKGRGVKAALVIAVRTKGVACLTAAVTTAAVFSCLLLSHSRALWEMGAITGIGILISLLTTLLLAPALVALMVRTRRLARKRPIASTTALRPAYRRFLRLRPGVVAVALILTGAIGYQAAQVRFRFVSDELAPATPSQGLLTTILREFAGEVWLGDAFRFFVSDPAEIAPLERTLAGHAMVHSVISVRSLLPQELLGGETSILDLPATDILRGFDDFGTRLAVWDEMLAKLQNHIIDLAQLEFAALIGGQPELAEALSRGIYDLTNLLWTLEQVDAETAQARLEEMSEDVAVLATLVQKVTDLPPEPVLLEQILAIVPIEIRSQLYTKSGKYVVEARMGRALREGNNLPLFLDWADELRVERFGLPEVTARLEEYMRRDFLVSTALALLVIFLLVWRDFPRPVEAALALAPLGMGYVWMLAGMNLIGIQFNFTNIVISPLLIGIGVDSAVHLLHRVKEERAEGGDAAVRGAAASAVPIAVSSLTTMASFGALLVAHTPGLRLLGTSALLGLGFTLLWSVTFLPAAAAFLVEKAKPRV